MVDIGRATHMAGEIVGLLDLSELRCTIIRDRARDLRDMLGVLSIYAAGERAKEVRERGQSDAFNTGYHQCLRDLGMVPKEKP